MYLLFTKKGILPSKCLEMGYNEKTILYNFMLYELELKEKANEEMKRKNN